MFKKIAVMVLLACSLLATFSVTSLAYTVTQPDQDESPPYLMQQSGTVAWQIPPFDSLKIDKTTFPADRSYYSLEGLTIAHFTEFIVIRTQLIQSGTYEGSWMYYAEKYKAGEPTGFLLQVYDWAETEDAIIVNLGITDTETRDWVFSPEDFPVVEGGWFETYENPPIMFYSQWTESASYVKDTVTANWVQQYMPLSNPHFEMTGNWYYQLGVQDGKLQGGNVSYDKGYKDGKRDGDALGYKRGYQEASEAPEFNDLISSVVSTPINTLKSIFMERTTNGETEVLTELELLGINVWAVFKSIIAILILLFIVTKVVKLFL